MFPCCPAGCCCFHRTAVCFCAVELQNGSCDNSLLVSSNLKSLPLGVAEAAKQSVLETLKPGLNGYLLSSVAICILQVAFLEAYLGLPVARDICFLMPSAFLLFTHELP